MAEELAALLAKRFVARKDVFAAQKPSGIYTPVETGSGDDKEYVRWKMSHFRDHVAGRASYGHYLLDTDDTCKLFAYDIDLVEGWPDPEDPKPGVLLPVTVSWRGQTWTGNPRAAWADPDCEPWLREALVNGLRGVAEDLAARVASKLRIEVGIAYSGNKGLHVYGFTGLKPAAQVRKAALLILRSYDGEFEPTKGDNFWRHAYFDTMSIEVFPKQDSLAGKNLGNLMRLPCGVNRKSKQEGFFLDTDTPWDDLYPADPVEALTNGTKLR